MSNRVRPRGKKRQKRETHGTPRPHHPLYTWRRKVRKTNRKTQRVMLVENETTAWVVKLTRPRPWAVRAKNRAKNRAARRQRRLS